MERANNSTLDASEHLPAERDSLPLLSRRHQPRHWQGFMLLAEAGPVSEGDRSPRTNCERPTWNM